jgi:hypothetical protein
MRLDGADFRAAIRNALESPGPVVCDVVLDPDQGFEPRQSSRQLPDGRIVSAPLEDLYPFLPREELAENLLIPPWEPGGRLARPASAGPPDGRPPGPGAWGTANAIHAPGAGCRDQRQVTLHAHGLTNRVRDTIGAQGGLPDLEAHAVSRDIFEDLFVAR